jgi:uncharacterized protein (DUF427 family)
VNKPDPEPQPHKIESVWDYPRPPRLEPCPLRIRVLHAGHTLADTTRALRILETSHPPVYYLPAADVAVSHLIQSPTRSSFCEFKGIATYWSVSVTDEEGRPAIVPDAAWSYGKPSPPYAALKDHIAFYASRVSECWVGEERVVPQPGDFYGGWITSNLRGPFKGAPGTRGW